MKQVKKLLVILPLVALFVLGSLPVLAYNPVDDKTQIDAAKKAITDAQNLIKDVVGSKDGSDVDPDKKWLPTDKLDSINAEIKALQTLLDDEKTEITAINDSKSKLDAAVKGVEPKAGSKAVEPSTEPSTKATEEKKCGLEKKDLKLTAQAPRIIAYDIHEGKWVYTRLNQLQMKEGWGSPRDYSVAFFEKSGLAADYIYAGFAADGQEPQMVYGGAYLESFGDYAEYFKNEYGASLVVFVVPKMVEVEVEHVFPEGTRDILKETVLVPYDVWASLQHSSTFMNLNDIFKTRIQKVNEMGYTFREVKFYDGRREITGLLMSWDWANIKLGGQRKGKVVARVFYDKAVAAAQEVPTEKKVDAATAPQAQIQAPAGQAPVAAANVATTTAPVNTLPVTGASDSIFLFLSSAALMAVGILFFKKH